MATEERVLCFQRKLLEAQGVRLGAGKCRAVVTPSATILYRNRTESEHDDRHNQRIPYGLIICDNKILRYRRGKGGQETRLHGLYSVGGGGHISEEDHGLF